MKRLFLLMVGFVALGGSLGACDNEPDGWYGPPPRRYDRCLQFTSCGTCTPIRGCGWCTYGSNTGICLEEPNECPTEMFTWVWTKAGCFLPDGGTDGASSSTDATSSAVDGPASVDAGTSD